MTHQILLTNRCSDLPLPARASTDAAGIDLRAAIDAPIVLEPGKRSLIPTGISIAMPPALEAQVRPRSGLAIRHGVTLLNSPGTIDADYRGEIAVILINHGEEPFEVRRGDRIAQLVFSSIVACELVPVDQLPDSPRGEGGFGSSGTG